MNDDFLGLKNMKSDPLELDLAGTTKTLVGGAVAIGLGLPLISAITELLS